LQAAGIVLLVAGTGSSLGTSYYFLKYRDAGDLDHPYPAGMMGKAMITGEKGGMMYRGGMMQKQTRGGSDSPDTQSGKATAPAAAGADEHASHPPAAGDKSPD
jgi:hypothetical protein